MSSYWINGARISDVVDTYRVSSATLNISSLAQAAWLLHSCLFGKWIVVAHAVLVIVFNAVVIFSAQQRLQRQPQRVLTLVNQLEDFLHISTAHVRR